MKIKSIKNGSIAILHNTSAGDELLQINGHPINDIIDYKFFSTDHLLNLKLKSKEGRIKRVEIRKQPDEDLGLEFYPIKYKSCNNNCIFCFVHQLPKGLRKVLYFKDEDFRLSFLHGNFITLTNTSNQDIKRIIKQRLSPLYISVHTTDEKLRKKILSNPQIPEIMPLIERLAQGRIEMHTQIVLCPGINDGEYLKKSIKDLSVFYPYVKSLALVPVGLTKFRNKLPKIQPVDKAYSRKVIQLVGGWQKFFRKKWGDGFVYAADEFFTKADLDIPHKRYYDEFYQVENGVGMMRQFLDKYKIQHRLLPRSLKKNLNVTLVTGVSAFRLIKQMIEQKINSMSDLKIRPVTVKNDFFGHTVTVTGLLTGADMLNTLRKQQNLSKIILLPPNCINQDGLFLDDLTPQDLEKELGRKVAIGSYDLVESLAKILTFPPLHFEAVSQPLKTHSCHSERSEESNSFNKLENRDSSANASE
jgi:putative radical SAM enzyme (TIGR03279 family)